MYSPALRFNEEIGGDVGIVLTEREGMRNLLPPGLVPLRDDSRSL